MLTFCPTFFMLLENKRRNMTLGQKIRELRKRANLTLRELQDKVHTDFTYLSKIENDKTDNRPPSEDLIRRIAKALKADGDELVSLLDRIPKDLEELLKKNKASVDFLRSAKGKSPEFWKKLKDDVEKGRIGDKGEQIH